MSMSFSSLESLILLVLVGLWVVGLVLAISMSRRVSTGTAICLTLVAIFVPLVGSLIVLGFWFIHAPRGRHLPPPPRF